MPLRLWDTGMWNGDEWFEVLNKDQRYLFFYLSNNDHCGQAGLYYITLTTISNESKIERALLPELIRALNPKVKWWPEDSLIWIVNFIKRQGQSPKFYTAAAKSLSTIKNLNAVEELLNYYQTRYSIDIPYQYPNHRVSILTRVNDPDPVPVSVPDDLKRIGVVKGEGKTQGENATPTSESEDDESLSPADHLVIDTWFSVKGFYLSPADASELVARIRTGFPRVDILSESKAWAVRKIAEPLTPESRITSQIWNWMKKADEISSRHKKAIGGEKGDDPKRFIKGKYGPNVASSLKDVENIYGMKHERSGIPEGNK